MGPPVCRLSLPGNVPGLVPGMLWSRAPWRLQQIEEINEIKPSPVVALGISQSLLGWVKANEAHRASCHSLIPRLTNWVWKD